MANEFYDIVERIGTKPVELVVGENPDGDRRVMISVTYTFRNEERRRVWLTRRQLESVYTLLGEFLGNDTEDAARTNTVNGNGSEPPF
jgi:hypothetical protein